MTPPARRSIRSPRCWGCLTRAAVEIDRLAALGNREAIAFPRPMWTRKTLDVSFAGLKTAVMTHLKRHGVPEPASEELHDLCASFQAAVVDVLVMKTLAAASQQHGRPGGALRRRVVQQARCARRWSRRRP